jgi:ribose 5-phosphate isomerase
MEKYIKKYGGATVKNGKIINYKSGYQVAIDSQEKIFKSFKKALEFIKSLKSCGVWINKNLIYIDTNTKRVSSKKNAIEIAKKNNQLAIWDWKNKKEIKI